MTFIVIVAEKVGANGMVMRVCQDHHKLNEATKNDLFPFPFIDIILDHMTSHKVYTFLDGMSRYHHTFIKRSDQIYITFIIDWGTYTFNQMPFGLPNASETFQRIMRNIFYDCLRHFVDIFIDTFVMYSQN